MNIENIFLLLDWKAFYIPILALAVYKHHWYYKELAANRQLWRQFIPSALFAGIIPLPFFISTTIADGLIGASHNAIAVILLVNTHINRSWKMESTND